MILFNMVGYIDHVYFACHWQNSNIIFLILLDYKAQCINIYSYVLVFMSWVYDHSHMMGFALLSQFMNLGDKYHCMLFQILEKIIVKHYA